VRLGALSGLWHELGLPEWRLVSMESAGLMVNDVCMSAGIPYNHGKNRIAYTGCVVL